MAALTIHHYLDIIDSFINNLTNSSKSYYLFMGRPQPWVNDSGANDDTAVQPADGSVNQHESTIYNDIVFGKLISNTNVSYMIPRYDWANNTYYDRYDQFDANLYSKAFYVLNDNYEVYKCIDNNNGANSTVKPSLTSTIGTFQTGDGYTWKYMYSVGSDANTNFTSTTYIPVTPNNYVTGNAVGGTIDVIRLLNGGNNYQAHYSGFLQGTVNNYVVTLDANAAPIDNYYVGSSMYLKSGFGAGQIRKITNYNGANKLVRVDSPFDTFINFNLDGYSGNFNVGDTLTQNIDSIAVSYTKGIFQVGDSIVQSDTGANGTIVTANSTVYKVVRNSLATTFSLGYPFINTSQSGTLKSGNVNIISGNNWVIANGGTSFTSNYSANDYIRVGSDANTNVRRVTSVNSTVIIVDSPFGNSATANVHYSMPYVAEPLSISLLSANGTVSNTNLNGVSINITNPNILGYYYIIGEKVNMVDGSGINQGVSATVSFANSSTVILTNVSGTGFIGGDTYFLKGESSLLENTIHAVTSYPNITISSPIGTFISGQNIFSKDSANLQITHGYANVISYYTIPNQLTEYVISPTVNIVGDGSGALAYSTVNTDIKSTLIIDSTNTISFTAGEIVYQSDGTANIGLGILYQANSSTLSISNTIGSFTVSPNSTFYITGFTSGATANVVSYNFSATSNNISRVIVINPGQGYTSANVTLTSNNTYGNGALAAATISPILGHGSDTHAELGARYAGVSVLIDSPTNESYKFPVYGKYRRVGIIENPLFADAMIQVGDFDRVKLTITNKNANTFVPGEIVIQSNTNAAGIVVYGNTTYLELRNVKGTFSANGKYANGSSSNDNILALSSLTTANVSLSNVAYFNVYSNVDIISETYSGASAYLKSIPGGQNSNLFLTNVTGKFEYNDIVYDAGSNAYANVTAIYAANGTIDVTSSFGRKFSQTVRFPLTSNTAAFQQFEYVKQQTSNSIGRVISNNNEFDFAIELPSGSFDTGNWVVSQNTGANAIVTFANSTYLRVTAANGQFYATDNIINNLGITAEIASVYPVLVLGDIQGPRFQAGSLSGNVVGTDSGAIGKCLLNNNNILYPDLVRDSGAVTYIENVSPFTITNTSQESVRLIIKF